MSSRRRPAESWSGGNPKAQVRGVTTDTRQCDSDKLFVALQGERHDGHDFVHQVDAAALLVSREVAAPPGTPLIRVADSLRALGELARFHRRRWGGRIVAVAGSAGKTTTRSAITGLLAAAAPGTVHPTPGNLNNLIGVPMVLLGLDDRHDIAVLELGTNTRGEVARLARIAQPEVVVVTLIALEHAEGIGDLDAVEEEEGDLFAAVPTDGVAVANGDDPRVLRQSRRAPARRRLTYGQQPDCDYRLLERMPQGALGARLVLERPNTGRRELIEVTTPLLGLPGALAVCAAIAVLDACSEAPVAESRLREMLAAIEIGETGRLVPVELAGGTLVIDDTYNANPASVLSAVEAARELAHERGSATVAGARRNARTRRVVETRARRPGAPAGALWGRPIVRSGRGCPAYCGNGAAWGPCRTVRRGCRGGVAAGTAGAARR